MAAQEGDLDTSAFVVTPPGANELSITVGMGENVQLTPEVRAQIEALLRSLMGSESLLPEEESAFKCGGAFTRCGSFTCTLDDCQPLKSTPCFQLVSCKIQLEQ